MQFIIIAVIQNMQSKLPIEKYMSCKQFEA